MWRKNRKINDEDRVINNPVRSRERTFDRAVNLLAYKPRSIEELRGRLLEKVWTNDDIVDEVIEKLKGYGYLDDLLYAKQLAASKIRQKAVGRRRLKMDLSKKKLDKETIEHALEQTFEETPEEDLIDLAIEKRLRLKGKPDDQKSKKNFFDHLLRLGFGYDLIRERMNKVASGGFDEPDSV
ncbi:MAG: RecX family transcriptional regulator [Pyrinomonadaceae bacterium]|nr:RecX family transcriptional regulator [Pyrinomonadaceae bacterium]